MEYTARANFWAQTVRALPLPDFFPAGRDISGPQRCSGGTRRPLRRRPTEGRRSRSSCLRGHTACRPIPWPVAADEIVDLYENHEAWAAAYPLASMCFTRELAHRTLLDLLEKLDAP